MSETTRKICPDCKINMTCSACMSGSIVLTNQQDRIAELERERDTYKAQVERLRDGLSEIASKNARNPLPKWMIAKAKDLLAECEKGASRE